MPFTGKKKKAFCLLEYVQTLSKKTEECICERICKNVPTAMQIWTITQKVHRGKAVCAEEKDSENRIYQSKICEIIHEIHRPLNFSFKF